MSGYQPGRRAPNVSQYIAGLNQIPQENDFVPDDSYNFEDDLALFTNTEFIHNDIIDFDLDFDFTQSIPGEEEYLKQQSQQEQQQESAAPSSEIKSTTLDIDSPTVKPAISPPPQISVTTKKQKVSTRSAKATKQALIASAASSPSSKLQSSASKPNTAEPANIAPGTKTSLSITTSPTGNNSSSLLGQQQQQSSPPSQVGNGDMNFDGDFHFTDIGFTPQGNITNHNIPYGASTSGYEFNVPPQSPFDPKHQLNTPVTTPPNGQVGVRPQGILPDAALLEASSRAAAEEDKRRRNTAASARFRFKKKQREQALEKSAKDMTDKMDKLEEKITQLEKENQWLRSLVIERTAKSSEEMAELYKTFKDEERSKEIPKKGVGTQEVKN